MTIHETLLGVQRLLHRSEASSRRFTIYSIYTRYYLMSLELSRNNLRPGFSWGLARMHRDDTCLSFHVGTYTSYIHLHIYVIDTQQYVYRYQKKF